MKKLNAIIEDVNSELSGRFIRGESVSMRDVESLLEARMRKEYKYHDFFVVWESNHIQFKDGISIEFKVRKRKRSGFVRYNEPKMTCVKLELEYEDVNDYMQLTIKELSERAKQNKLNREKRAQDNEQNAINEFEAMLKEHSMTRDEFRTMESLYKKLPYSEQYKK